MMSHTYRQELPGLWGTWWRSFCLGGACRRLFQIFLQEEVGTSQHDNDSELTYWCAQRTIRWRPAAILSGWLNSQSGLNVRRGPCTSSRKCASNQRCKFTFWIGTKGFVVFVKAFLHPLLLSILQISYLVISQSPGLTKELLVPGEWYHSHFAVYWSLRAPFLAGWFFKTKEKKTSTRWQVSTINRVDFANNNSKLCEPCEPSSYWSWAGKESLCW